MPGWDEHSRAGYSNGDPFEMPADLAAVQADDALLDMIGAGHAPSDANDELTRVLAAWRHEVHAEPVKELVDTSTALAVIRAAARQPARRRNPMFGSIAGAAAVVVIAFSSVGLVAKSAEPGDTLWGVTQVIFSEYAESVETAAVVRTELNEANKALQQGNPQRAREALRHIQQKLPAVGESEGRTELTTAQQKLEQQLNKPPDPGWVNLPGASGFPPPAPEETRSEAGKPDGLGASSPKGPTTRPGPDGGLPSDSTKHSHQFLPGPHYPSHDYPYPGAAGPGRSPERGAQDYRPPRDGRDFSRGATSDSPSGQTPGDTRSGGPSPSPSPRPSPDSGQTSGTNGSTGSSG
ncbi:MAG: anti-sigma-D factor RsdA, partial [Pseudonocardiaceae bacterium]